MASDSSRLLLSERINLNYQADNQRYAMYIASDYSPRFLKSLKQLWQNGVFCDVSINVGVRTFHAHRIVLSAGCAFFRAMFESGLVEDRTAQIDIREVHADIFKSLLDFIYTGEVEIREDNCQDLLAAANMYEITEVVALCCQFLKHLLHEENCLGIYLFADAHACLDLKQDAERYINIHFEHLANEEEFLELPVELVVKLLQSENLCIEDEYQVLSAGLNWLLHDPSKRRKHVFDILTPVRIPIIPDKELNNIMDHCHDISLKVVLQKYIQDFRFDRKVCMKLKQSNMSAYMLKPRKSARKSIYVMGGNKQCDKWRWGDGITVPTVERFDTYKKRWYHVPEMQYPRSSHGAAVLNGQIYVVGGEHESLISDTVEFYDPPSNKWNMGPCLIFPRCGLGVCSVNDRLYAFGGWVGTRLDDTVEEYDPEENEWTVICTMPIARYAMGVVESQGLIYLIGGLDADECDLSVVHSFNPVTREWNRLPDLKVSRSHPGVAALDGELYAVGGMNRFQGDLLTVEKFLQKKEEWVNIAPLSDRRSASCATSVNGLIYMVGGQKSMDRFSSYSTPITLDTIECYNPKCNMWSKLPCMPEDRSKAASAVL